MAKHIVMPKLGLTMKEGTIVKWLINEGDAIQAGDEIYEVETDKLTNKIEAADDGILRKILVEEGETVECFAPVGIVGTEDADISELIESAQDVESLKKPAEEVEEKVISVEKETVASETVAPIINEGERIIASPAARALANRSRADIRRIEGTGPNGRIVLEDVKNYDGPPRPLGEGERIIASPAAKKLAKEEEIDLEKVLGTGPKGRLVLRDVENYKEVVEKASVSATPLAEKIAVEKGVSLSDIPSDGRVTSTDVRGFIGPEPVVREEREKMTGMRKTIAKRMIESQETSARVNFDISVDMTEMKNIREKLNSTGMKVSYTDLIVKMVSVILPDFPDLNCRVEGDEIVYLNYVNMGVAVAVDEGLLVPVVKDAHIKSLEDISDEIKDLALDARNNTLEMDALSGGTFTVSNLGMFGIESFTPIINQPEVAILGVNAMEDTPKVIDGEIVIRPIMKFSLTADHRIIDGAVAAAFLSKFKKFMENPGLLLAL